MTPEQVLDKYRSIVVVNSDQVALELGVHLNKLPLSEQRKHFGGNYAHGFFWLFRHESNAGKVMETVASPAGDAITSIYVDSPYLASIGEVMRAREELIKAVSQKLGLSAGAIGVEDPARGRALGLAELSTGQLVDILAERMGSSIVTASNRGGDAELAAALIQ